MDRNGFFRLDGQSGCSQLVFEGFALDRLEEAGAEGRVDFIAQPMIFSVSSRHSISGILSILLVLSILSARGHR